MKNLQPFNQIIDRIQLNIDPETIFSEADRQFLLKPFKLKKFSIKKTVMNYVQMSKKYESGQISLWKEEWHKNQRKLFIQFLICYCKLNSTSPQIMNDMEWNKLSCIFFEKNPIFLKFQGLSIMKNLNKINWTQEDDQLIKKNIMYFGEGNWNQISKGLFFETECMKYFSPKQIRQRWYNHLSQNVKRSSWSIEQDLIILQHVHIKNKRWCEIVKLFKHSRTEHMIKNRFKYLIKRSSSSRPTKQSRLVSIALSKIKKKMQSSKNSIKPSTIQTDKNIKNSVPTFIDQKNCQQFQQKEIILNPKNAYQETQGLQGLSKTSNSQLNFVAVGSYPSFQPTFVGLYFPVAPNESKLSQNNCLLSVKLDGSPDTNEVFSPPSLIFSPSFNNYQQQTINSGIAMWPSNFTFFNPFSQWQ